MKKNLLDKKTVNETVARAELLQLTSKARWGAMEVTEMLHHCNLTSREILEGKSEYKKSSLKQRIIKFLALYIVPQFPKNIKGAARHETKGNISADQFDREKDIFIETIKKFADRKELIRSMHPVFGNLSTRQWGVAAWMHIDHHLRQFGV